MLVKQGMLPFTSSCCRWVSASGNDEVCSCCDTGCTVRKGRSLAPAGMTSVGFDLNPCCLTGSWQGVACSPAVQYSGSAFLGPLVVQMPGDVLPEPSTPLKAEDHGATGIHPVKDHLEFPPGKFLANALGSLSFPGVSPEAVVMAGVVAAVGLACMIVLVTLLRRFKPTAL